MFRDCSGIKLLLEIAHTGLRKSDIGITRNSSNSDSSNRDCSNNDGSNSDCSNSD